MSDEQNAWEAKKAKAAEFVKDVEKGFPLNIGSDLEDALYTFNEMGVWKGDTELSLDDAIRAWALIEKLRQVGEFPEDLVM